MRLLLVTVAIAMLSACQPASNTGTNANLNANSPAANANAAPSNTNTGGNANAGLAIDAREPEKYSATLLFSLETEGGDKAIGIPPLSAQVARSGDDRRIEFKLPDGSTLIYVDHNNQHFVIVPARKQYAELTPEATGVQIQKLMTAGQLVQSLKNVRGVQMVGEAPMNGRTAEKYSYAASTNTNTQAGQVSAQAFVYVDKETGLPLRAELISESSGDVKGVKAARIVAEMRDIKTDIDASLFAVPAGYAQVPPEKIRQQVDALTTAVGAVLKAMIGGMETPPSSPSPAATTSPRSN